MDLKDSKTRENLMRAFAGESMARNRYTFAAELAQNNGYYVLKKVFDYTAEQEKQHAEVFQKFLKELDGESIEIHAGYPVNASGDLLTQLKQAVSNEYAEYDNLYKEFGDTAKEEGFTQIASKFYLIADIEKTHGKRLEEFVKLLEEGKLFVSDVKTGWVCLNCGYVVESEIAPQNCPVCDSAQGYFVRLSLAPYTECKKC